ERLGKVAGIAGISVGAVVLLLNALVGTIPGLPLDQRADIVRLLAALSFGIGVIGLIAWLLSRRPARSDVSTVGVQSPAVSAGGGVDISYGTAGSPQSAAPQPTQAASPPAGATARTAGDQSPAVVS